MAYPCADCDLLNVGDSRCRITNLVRAALDECTLTIVQQRDLLMQSKRLVAARGSAREVVIDSVDIAIGGPGCSHIRFNATVDGNPETRVVTKTEFLDLIAQKSPFDRVQFCMVELLVAAGADTPAEVEAALAGGVFYIGPS